MSRTRVEPVAIAVMAKAPVPGLAKTRLATVLGDQGAAALQEQLTARTVALACTAEIGPVTLWATPDASHASFCGLAHRQRLSLRNQPDGDIGMRMLVALQAANGPAIVIGTDCPALTLQHLHVTAAHLRDGMDAVLIAAEDGGYVLIGMRAPHPLLFSAMTWSSDTVAAETRRRLARLGLAWREPARLWDVDRPEDLARLDGLNWWRSPLPPDRRTPSPARA
jgi:rSAM/selenodomain-associated transferase 1